MLVNASKMLVKSRQTIRIQLLFFFEHDNKYKINYYKLIKY